jgi:hypothetical protein
VSGEPGALQYLFCAPVVHRSNIIKLSYNGIQEKIPNHRHEIKEKHSRENIPDLESVFEDITVAHHKEAHRSKTCQQKFAD